MKVIYLILALLSVSAFSQKVIQFDAQTLMRDSTGGGNGGEYLEALVESQQQLLDQSLSKVEKFLTKRDIERNELSGKDLLKTLKEYDFIVSPSLQLVKNKNIVLVPLSEIVLVSSNEAHLHDYVLSLIIELSLKE